MSAGVLQFALGLTTGGFVEKLNQARSKTKEFSTEFLKVGAAALGVSAVMGSLSSIERVIDGMFDAISRGAELERLSKRTSTSVASLFELQKGFKAVGLSSDDVSPMIFKMQKSLGGINDMGEDVRSVFTQIGLSIDTLKQKSAPQQFQAIGAALSKLNASAAASAAQSIFGREGAANMIQLAHSTGDFGAAMAKAQKDAELFQRNAEAFNHLQISLDAVKGKANTVFAGMAEGAAPAIQMIVDKLNSIDFTAIGQKIGKVFTAFIEAFREGKVSELIGLSLTTGFQMGLAAAPVLFEKLGLFLLRVFETPLEYLQGGMTYVVEKAMEGFGKLESMFHGLVNILAAGLQFAIEKLVEKLAKIPKLNKLLGIEGYTADSFGKTLDDQNKQNPDAARFKADSFADIMKDEKQNGLKFNMGAGEMGLGDVQDDVDKRWADMKAKLKNLSGPLVAFVDGLVSRAPKNKGGDPKDNSGAGLPIKNDYKPEFTSFEKMGFVMGGNNNAIDYARRTANATEAIRAALIKPDPAGAAKVDNDKVVNLN